ncbi:MAG: hypothetical protein JXN61_11725 [Sedimentisphaerales bacterium]|nr:hypothetical protein [Sedimentisphaerales bacterium]
MELCIIKYHLQELQTLLADADPNDHTYFTLRNAIDELLRKPFMEATEVKIP